MKQKYGAWGIAPQCQISQWRAHCTKWKLAPANVQKTALAKWVGF